MVAAHGGLARLMPDPAQVAPGGTITIRADDVGADADLELSLRGINGEVALGNATADGLGHFVLPLALPSELPQGIYVVEGTFGPVRVESTPITVVGQPIEPENGADPQGGRDEDDPLLVALPSGWQQSLADQTTSLPPEPAANVSGDPTVFVVIATGVVLLLCGLLLVALVRRRGRNSAI